MKKVLKYLEENDRKDEVEEFKKNINNVMKELMSHFKDLQFFTGKTCLCISFTSVKAFGSGQDLAEIYKPRV